jgi:hypothetical protein
MSTTHSDLLGSQLSGALLGHLGLGGLSLGNLGRLLLNHQLNVCGAGHVGTDSTVGSVSASSHIGGLVAVGVGDLDLLGVEALGLAVSLQVAKQVQEGLGGLLGPEALVTGGLELLGLGVSASSSTVLGEGDSLLVSQNVLQEQLSSLQSHTLKNASDLTGVLVVHSQVSGTSLGSLSGGNGISAINKIWEIM